MCRVGLDGVVWKAGTAHTPRTEEPLVTGWAPRPRGCPHLFPVLLTRAAEQRGDVLVIVNVRAPSVGQHVGARHRAQLPGAGAWELPRPASLSSSTVASARHVTRLASRHLTRSVPFTHTLCSPGFSRVPSTVSVPPASTQVLVPTVRLTCTYLEDAVQGPADPSLLSVLSSLAGDADARWPCALLPAHTSPEW